MMRSWDGKTMRTIRQNLAALAAFALLAAAGPAFAQAAGPAEGGVAPEPGADTWRGTYTLAEAVPGADGSAADTDDFRAAAASAGGPRVAIGAEVSTLGFGPSAAIVLNDYFVVSLSGNYASASTDKKISGVRYDIDADLRAAGATLDWHPFANGFFLSGGAYWNGSDFDIAATPAGPVTVGGAVFTPAQIGRLDGNVEFNDIAPYVGLGFDNTNRTHGRLSIYASAGVMYQGQADVDLAVSGPAATLPGFQAQLDREIDDIENDIEDVLQFYPVIRLGLRWRF